MINIFRTFKSTPLSKVTIFHNPSSATSNHLLSKLNKFSQLPCTSNRYLGPTARATTRELGKFSVDLHEDKMPTYEEYLEIHDLLSVHPDNAIAFEKIFPLMYDHQSSTICKKSAFTTKKKQKYLGDLQVFNQQDYKTVEAAFAAEKLDLMFNAPLIIDWENSLLAVDDAGLDRIMANYLSCGTQDSHKSNLDNYRPITKSYKQEQVHPHVAEFADLF